MRTSNSNLLNYISLLMSDDDALNKFLVDPITDAEGKHGITKAERAVLRRTVAHLSNKSKNGYTVSRHLGSYRRSLRLLQNVLHNTGSKMVQDANKSTEDSSSGLNSYSMIVYFPFNSQSSEVNLTCKTNEYIKENYKSSYTNNSTTFTVKLAGKVTIKDVMDEVKNYYKSQFNYATVAIEGSNKETEDFISYIYCNTFKEYSAFADISNNCYNLDKNPGADYVFWFYSINGKANLITSGNLGESFTKKVLNPNDTIYWQLIAPDKRYGFNPCDTTEGAEYNK